jgi:hypothetical protein
MTEFGRERVDSTEDGAGEEDEGCFEMHGCQMVMSVVR